MKSAEGQLLIGTPVSITLPSGKANGKIAMIRPYFHGEVKYEVHGFIGKHPFESIVSEQGIEALPHE